MNKFPVNNNNIILAIRNTHPFVVHVAILFGLFIGLSFDFGIEGDDIYTLSDILRERMALSGREYLDVARSRHYLQWTLNQVYVSLGKSQFLMQWLFISLWTIINPVLLYLLLKKISRKDVALICAVFFLVYSGKFEVATTISGGLYHFVILVFILILHVLFSRWGLMNKALMISFLFFLSFHLYEILIPATILVPVYIWYESYIKKDKINFKKIFLSFLPVYFAILHLLILGTHANPIWNRSGGSLDIIELFRLMPGAFAGSLSTFVGQPHVSLLLDNYQSIPRLVALNAGIASVISTLVFTMIAFILFLKVSTLSANENAVHYRPKKLVFLGLGFFLIFIAPLVSIPIYKGAGFVPSRFSYLPALGMVFIFIVLFDHAKKIKVYLSAAFISIWILSEAISMRGILFQYSEAARLDGHLRTSIAAYRLSINPKDVVFISMYENGYMHRILKQASYKFENGGAQSLLLLDNPNLFFEDPDFQLHERLLFKNYLRRIDEDESAGLLPLITTYSNLRKVYPFILKQDETLCAITQISVTNKDNEILFSEPTGIPFTENKLCYEAATIRNVYLKDKMIEAPGSIFMYSGNDSTLTIEGELFHGDGPLVASAVREDTGEILGTMSLRLPGKFIWVIPLGPKPRPFEIKLINRKQDEPSGRALWKLHDLYTSR